MAAAPARYPVEPLAPGMAGMYGPATYQGPYYDPEARGTGFLSAEPSRYRVTSTGPIGVTRTGRSRAEGLAQSRAEATQILMRAQGVTQKPKKGWGKGEYRNALRQVGRHNLVLRTEDVPPLTRQRMLEAFDRKTDRLNDPNYRAMRKKLREVKIDYTRAAINSGSQPTWRYSQKAVFPSPPKVKQPSEYKSEKTRLAAEQGKRTRAIRRGERAAEAERRVIELSRGARRM